MNVVPESHEALWIGAIVRPKNGMPPHSGCSVYGAAVVVSLEPFIILSQEGDMMWSATITPDELVVVGSADTETKINCNKRLSRGGYA